MPPPRAVSAEIAEAPEVLAERIEAFLRAHPATLVSEAGKLLFDLRQSQWSVTAEHGRCSLQLWSDERNVARRIVAATERNGTLKLGALRLGQTRPTSLELAGTRERRTTGTREAHRERYVTTLVRVLAREFAEWKAVAFRTAMDLEKSFGPAYARGSLVRGQQAWAVIGVNSQESTATIDGIVTLGVLWLQACRESSRGRLYVGLRLILPRGAAALTLARLPWMNADAAQWELWELDEGSEEFTARDPADTGNLRTRLVHRPDPAAAAERFAAAAAEVLSLLPTAEHSRVQQHLRSPTEMVFLLHGLPFARAVMSYAGRGFQQHIELTVGTGANETPMNDTTREALRTLLLDLFARRRAGAAHSARDPLYRAAPERWLESVLQRDLAPLTRHLAPELPRAPRTQTAREADDDDDAHGNRAETSRAETGRAEAGHVGAGHVESDLAGPVRPQPAEPSRLIPRLVPEHVYAQVPAIAGASDTGLLDLLALTADGRLAVIELKVAEDLHFALQGLDYWIRVRAHQRNRTDAATGMPAPDGEFQRAGYFTGCTLSDRDPRLYLVAPALHIHPATDVVLRYISPRVEWCLLALDEHWRSHVRVVWRKGASTS